MSSNQDDFEQFSQELRLVGQFNESIKLIGGLYYNDNEINFGRILTFCGGPGSNCVDASDPAYTGLQRSDLSNQTSETISVFGQIDFQLTDQIVLGVGGRFTDEKKEVSGRKFLSDIIGFNPGPGAPVPGTDFMGGGGCASLGGTLNGRPVTCFGPLNAGSNSGDLSRRESDFSPNAVLQWFPADGHNLYFSYAQGFKGGGYELWSTAPGIITADQVEFAGEEAEAFEVGGKHTLLDNTLRVNWAFFQNTIQDLQVSSFDPVLLVQNIGNAGEARSRGFELDATWLPDDYHRVNFAGLYLDGVYLAYEGATCYPGQSAAEGCVGGLQDLSGTDLQYSPEFQFNVGLAGTYPLTQSLGGIDVGWKADVIWVADQFIGSKNNPITDIQEEYAKLNASVFLEPSNGLWRLSLIGRNLTDEITANFANDTNQPRTPIAEPGYPTRPTFYFVAPGRQIALQLKINF